MGGQGGRAERAGMRAAADLRLLRAALFALVCVTLTAAGHSLGAGCAAIPVGSLALAWVVVFAAAALLAGRERSAGSIAAALAVGQLGLHLLFMSAQFGARGRDAADRLADRLLCGASHGAALPGDPSSAEVLRRAGLSDALHQQIAAHSAGTAMPSMAGGGQAWLGLTPGMLAGHLLAAVAVGWWLRRGEAALWRVLRLAARAAGGLRLVLALAVAVLASAAAGKPGPVRRVRRDERAPDPSRVLLLHCVVRRGPPGAFAAAA